MPRGGPGRDPELEKGGRVRAVGIWTNPRRPEQRLLMRNGVVMEGRAQQRQRRSAQVMYKSQRFTWRQGVEGSLQVVGKKHWSRPLRGHRTAGAWTSSLGMQMGLQGELGVPVSQGYVCGRAICTILKLGGKRGQRWGGKEQEEHVRTKEKF